MKNMLNMIGAGIVDPAKVTRSALQNAASASAMLLTTEAGVTDAPGRRRSGNAADGRRHGRRNAWHDVSLMHLTK